MLRSFRWQTDLEFWINRITIIDKNELPQVSRGEWCIILLFELVAVKLRRQSIHPLDANLASQIKKTPTSSKLLGNSKSTPEYAHQRPYVQWRRLAWTSALLSQLRWRPHNQTWPVKTHNEAAIDWSILFEKTTCLDPNFSWFLSSQAWLFCAKVW